MKRRHWIAGLVAIAISLLVACPDEPAPENLPIEADEVSERLEEDLREHRAAAEASMGWIAETRIWQSSELPAVDAFDDESERDFEAWMSFLTNYVFIDEHVEEDAARSVIYLLDGERVCEGLDVELEGRISDFIVFNPVDMTTDLVGEAPTEIAEAAGEFERLPTLAGGPNIDEMNDINQFAADGFDRERCQENIDAAQVRLRVTAPSAATLGIALQIDEERYEPIAFRISPETSLTEIDLEESLQSLQAVRQAVDLDDSTDLPEVIEGRVRSSFEIEADARTLQQMSVVDDIRIESDNTTLNIESADPFFERRVNGDIEELVTTIDIGRIALGFPIEEREEVDEDQRLDSELIVDSFSLIATLTAEDDDELLLSNIRPEQPLSWVIDGETVFELSWSLIDEDALDLVLRAENDVTGVELVPAVELILDFQFGDLTERLDLPAWLADHTWVIRIDDAGAPVIEADSVIDGPDSTDEAGIF